MIIKEIRIGSFAGIENKVVNFERGMNVIYGNNEAGKSRIESFIKAMLYGLSSKRIKGENERKRYISFNRDTAYGEMVVLHKNRQYLIKRKFGNTKKQDSSEIFDFLSGEKIQYINSEEPGKYFLGINRSTFEKTLYIGQLSVAFHKDKEEEIMDKVTALFGCGDHEVSGEKVMEKFGELKKSYVAARGGGSLDLLKKRYDELLQERYEGNVIAEKNLDWEKELIESRENKKKIQCEINNLEVYKKYLKKIKLQKEYREIIQYFKESEELKTKENELIEHLSNGKEEINEDFLNKLSEENSYYLRLLDEKKERVEELDYYKSFCEDKKSEFEKYKFIDLFGDNLKDRLLEIKYEQQSLKGKINTSEEIKSLIENEEKELESKKAVFYKLKDNENIIDNIKTDLDLYELKLKGLKEIAYSEDYMLDEKEKNTEKFKILLGFLLLVLGVVLFFIKQLNIIIPILVSGLAIFILIAGKINCDKLQNNKSEKMEELTKEIENIEKSLDEYREQLELENNEQLIKYIKKYMMFKQYEEKMIIRIEEKKRILRSNSYEDIKKKYNKNNEMVKSLIKISNCKNINEVLDAVDKFEKINSELEVINEKIESTKSVIDNLENNIKNKEFILKEKLKIIGAEEKDLLDIDVFIKEYREKIKKREELHYKLQSIERTYSALIKDRDINEIKEELKDIISFDKSYDFDSEEEIEKEEKIKSNQLIECEKNIKDVENKINTRLIGKRSLVEIEEEIEDVSKKINKYEKNVKAVNLAMETLQESMMEVRETVGPALNNSISNVFSYLTDGKYNEIKLGSNYEMMVRGKNDLIKGNYLSNGTFDQLYLSLRIALIELLFKDEECSIILDDAFVQYDNERRETAVKLIAEKIKGQVLIFTCHTIEREIMIKDGIKFNYIAI